MNETMQWVLAIAGALAFMFFLGWILSMTPENQKTICLKTIAETNCNTQSMEYKDRQQDHYYCVDSLKNLQTKYYTRTELEKCGRRLWE